MRVISNAFLYQAEITQSDRWNYGPLEIHFVPEPQDSSRLEFTGRVAIWNRKQTGGYFRDTESLEFLQSLGIDLGQNPNHVIAPTHCGYSELLGMLGSLLPDSLLGQYDIARPVASFWLYPFVDAIGIRSKRLDEAEESEVDIADIDLECLTNRHLKTLAWAIPRAFERWIWKQLVKRDRFGIRNYSKDSSLRVLSGDIRFWMHRLYRIAIDLYEDVPPTQYEEKDWVSLKELQRQLDSEVPKADLINVELKRPRMGGCLWHEDSGEDRDRIADLLIDGDPTTESLEPIVDAILSNATHEDFSDRYSWIKEDFERSFYSKRSKIKVKLCEFVDECPVHEGTETPGYEDILFRDVMAFFDQREQRIVLALRQGRTKSAIAEELGHSGHASISRRIKKIEHKMRRLLHV
jgi:hypothetical protein